MVEALGKRLELETEDGFTLVELMVVLAMIGVLVTIAVASFLGFGDRAAAASAKADIRAAVPSAEAYFGDKGTYAGMTVSALRASYDSGLAPQVAIGGTPTATSYCLVATVRGQSWSAKGPGIGASSFKQGTTCS